ncbi:MAG: AdeC/AdeK/OprM family multidrug efflux complex outer membrane factor [Deltaproteobacteria bacterium]|nr:AdeC/AdeK/OprM family multidrug efflux complex outer membrane factor [Deltaproteobacteria bacterium]
MKKWTTAVLRLSVAALACLTGCTMAPVYVRPVAPVPASWPSGPAYQNPEAGAPAAVDLPWKEFFVDERLRKLLALALENNRDLGIAALTIERSRAQYQIQRAELLPKVNATGGASAQRVSADLSPTGDAVVSHQYTVGAGLSAYELDLFGRVRSLKDRALERFLATEQARRSVQISLLSEIATRYLTLGTDLERLKLAHETLTAQETSYGLNKRRFELGVSSELDLRQAQTTVETARSDIARYTGQVAQDKNALELLVGARLPSELLPTELGAVAAVKDFSPGLPSELLQRRPDIQAAERQLRGASANIGAARAAFFPRITLTTSLGLGSSELSGLFDGGAGMWSFLPQITVPIFDWGTNRANLKVAEVDREILLAQYEKAIQGAFREVADALAVQGTVGDQLAAQEALVEAASVTYKLSDARYRNGVDSYLAVLDSQRALYAAQQNLITVRLSRLSNLVTLYKVLGGGA